LFKREAVTLNFPHLIASLDSTESTSFSNSDPFSTQTKAHILEAASNTL